MARLIDADKCHSYFYDHLDEKGMVGAMNAVEEMPTVDAEPVRHGRWTEDGLCMGCGFDALYLENTSIQVRSHYCPNCGAKMDAEVERC